MSKLLTSISALSVLLVPVTVAQIVDLRMQSPIPSAPAASASVIGNPGTSTYNYYVVATYGGGTVVSAATPVQFAPASMSVANYVNVGWAPLSGVVTYDVLRTTAPATFIGGTCVCAVATGLITSSFSNISNTISSYTLAAGAVSATGVLYVNNVNYTPPQLRQIINGVDMPVGTGSGSVTTVNTGCGLAGGPITISGTLSGTGPCEAASSGGTAQAQTATYSPAPTLANGLWLCWKPTVANTGSGPSFTPNGLSAKVIVKAGGSSLIAGDIATTAQACVIYNTIQDQWELQNPQTQSSPQIIYVSRFSGATLRARIQAAINSTSTGALIIVDLPPGSFGDSTTLLVGTPSIPIDLWFVNNGIYTCTGNPCMQEFSHGRIRGISKRSSTISKSGSGPIIMAQQPAEDFFVLDLALIGGDIAIKTQGPSGQSGGVPGVHLRDLFLEFQTANAIEITALADTADITEVQVVYPVVNCLRIGALTNGETTTDAQENATITNFMCVGAGDSGVKIYNDSPGSSGLLAGTGWTFSSIQFQTSGKHAFEWNGGCVACSLMNTVASGVIGSLSANTYDVIHFSGDAWTGMYVGGLSWQGSTTQTRYGVYWVASQPYLMSNCVLTGSWANGATNGAYLFGNIEFNTAAAGALTLNPASNYSSRKFGNQAGNGWYWQVGPPNGSTSGTSLYYDQTNGGGLRGLNSGVNINWVIGDYLLGPCATRDGLHMAIGPSPGSTSASWYMCSDSSNLVTIYDSSSRALLHASGSGGVQLGSSKLMQVYPTGQSAHGSVLTSSLPACSVSATPGAFAPEGSVYDASAPVLGVALTGGGTVWAHVHCSLTSGTYIVDGL